MWNFLFHRIKNYNLFIPDEDDYEQESRDPAMVLRQQKYTTWLYILLLISTF